MILPWLSVIAERKKKKLEDSIAIVRCILKFMRSRTEIAGASDASEKVSTQVPSSFCGGI
ncbi:hypothetical protein DsansV1_C03g0024171 [Dioscorea sansibarensis]